MLITKIIRVNDNYKKLLLYIKILSLIIFYNHLLFLIDLISSHIPHNLIDKFNQYVEFNEPDHDF